MPPFSKAAPKIYVIIRGKDIEPGWYDNWNHVKGSLLNVKKADGYNLEWQKFDGRDRHAEALRCWHLHFAETPRHLRE